MTVSIYRRPSFALALGGIVLVVAFLILSGGLSSQAAPTGRIWMADPSSDRVFRVDNDGTGLTSVPVTNAFDVAFDDTQAYVTQFDTRTIAVLLRSDMSPVTTLTPPWASLKLDPNGLDSGGALAGIDVVPGTPTVYTANEGGFTELGGTGQSTYGRCDAESDNPGGPCTITDVNHTDADPVLKFDGPWSVQYLIDRSQTVGGFSQADPFTDPPPSGTLPSFNRGLALSPDNRYLYLGYNNPNGTGNTTIHDKQVRRVDTTEPDYTNATVDILQGNRGKALATDDVGRVYMAEGSDTDTLDGPGIHIYSADLSTKLADIALGGINGLARPEGVATTREAGVLVLYVTDRTNKTLSRFVITEAPVGDGILAITRAGLDGDGEITIPGAMSLRGVEVEPLEAPTPTPSPSPTPTPPPGLDHFKCYQAQDLQPQPPGQVTLNDQFGTEQATVLRAVELCNPVQKTHNNVITPITNPDSHLTWYQLATQAEPLRIVDVQNQFGQQQLTVTDPVFLAVPTQKQPHGPPFGLSHFKCYRASGQPINQTVDLVDQFHAEPGVAVLIPEFFCNPVEKIHNAVDYPILDEVDHLTCYRITSQGFNTTVSISNQFGQDTLAIFPATHLCVPSLKLAVNTPTIPPTPTPPETPTPTPFVTESPTPVVTASPTPVVTNSPTPMPTNSPTPVPTNSPTPVPTNSPTPVPTNSPTPVPTNSPTPVPTNSPTPAPTNSPTPSPTALPGSQTPHPTGAVGGLVDVLTTGSGGSSSGGLSLIALLGMLAALTTVGGTGAYAIARRRND